MLGYKGVMFDRMNSTGVPQFKFYQYKNLLKFQRNIIINEKLENKEG